MAYKEAGFWFLAAHDYIWCNRLARHIENTATFLLTDRYRHQVQPLKLTRTINYRTIGALHLKCNTIGIDDWRKNHWSGSLVISGGENIDSLRSRLEKYWICQITLPFACFSNKLIKLLNSYRQSQRLLLHCCNASLPWILEPLWPYSCVAIRRYRPLRPKVSDSNKPGQQHWP